MCISIEYLALESLGHATETHERRLSFSSLSLPTLRALEPCFARNRVFRGSLHRTYPRLVLAWIHVMRGLGRFELWALVSSELANLLQVMMSSRSMARSGYNFACLHAQLSRAPNLRKEWVDAV